MALQILGRKIYKNTEKSCLYFHRLIIIIHKTPTTREIRELINTQTKVSNIASDEDIVENNHMFAMLWNLSVISHLIFQKCFFFISGAKSKNNLRGYVAF